MAGSLDRVVIDRSRRLVPADAHISQVFVGRTGPNPLILPIAVGAWVGVSVLFGATVAGAWVLLLMAPFLLVYVVHVLESTRTRVVWVADEAVYVVAVRRSGGKGTELRATLPRETRLGPMTGLWGRTRSSGEPGPIETTWKRLRLGEEKVWVHKRFHDVVAAADTARPSPVGAPPPSPGEPADLGPPGGPPRPPVTIAWRSPRPVVVPALLIAGGALVALIAVVRASAAVLAVATLLLVAGAVVTAVRTRPFDDRGKRAAVVAGVVALAAAILVPASMHVDRCARLGRGADLSGCDLSHRDLTGEDLHGADLRRADLRGSNLAGVDLGTADLGEARLRRANLSDADLTRARAPDADLRDADLTEAHLRYAISTGADLRGADATGAFLVGTDLRRATGHGVTLTRADLTDAHLGEVDLSDADLTGTVLDGAHLSAADLSGGRLAGADLTDAGLRGADLSCAVLAATPEPAAGPSSQAATLDGADLHEADLSGADLRGVRAAGADFEDADLTGAELLANDFVGAAGVGSDDLSVAFGVPGSHVAGEAARRGVVLDTYDEIVQAVTPVQTGQPVPEVQPYSLNDEFHPAIVFDSPLLPGAPGWADGVRERWAPTAVRFAELVVVESRGQDVVDSCQYTYIDDGTPAPPTFRYVPTVTVRVLRAHDGGVVGERTFRGGQPGPCPVTKQISLGETGEVVGAQPDIGTLARPWLEDLINPPAQRRGPA